MSAPAIQLSFSLRTSANVQSVHLVGSWDGYKSQLPLSTGAKAGSWKGTFRFQGSHALKLGTRYWYYYIVDGYHVAHDPAKEFTTEKTTGRKLNILDVPAGKSTKAPPSAINTAEANSRHAREIPQGRPVSPCKIACPKPSKPYASRQLREADYETSPIDAMDEMAEQFSLASLNTDRVPMHYNSSDVSDTSSSGPTFSSVSGASDNSRHSAARASPVKAMQQQKLAASRHR